MHINANQTNVSIKVQQMLDSKNRASQDSMEAMHLMEQLNPINVLKSLLPMVLGVLSKVSG